MPIVSLQDLPQKSNIIPLSALPGGDQPGTPSGVSTITGEPITAGEAPAVRSFREDIAENWPIYAGATVGGITGGIPGAGLGGAAGEAYKQIRDREEPDAPQTSMEAAKRIATTGATQAAYEAGGRLVVGAAGKMLKPFAKTITPEGKVAQEVFEKYMPVEKSWKRPVSKALGLKKPGVLPAEMTEQYSLDLMQNIAEKSVVGGKTMADFKNITRTNAMNEITDDLVNSFGESASQSELGDLVATGVKTNFRSFKDNVTAPLYNKVNELTSAKPVHVFVKPLKDSVKAKLKVGRQLSGMEAKAAGDDLARAVSELPNSVPFDVAQHLRTRLMSTADEFAVSNKKAPAIGIAKKLTGKVDDAISAALKDQNPEAHEVWRKANDLYKYGSKQYNNRFLRGLIRKADPDFGGEPEKVVKSIFQKNGPSGIKKVKAAIGEKEFNQLKSWHVQDTIARSMKDDVLDGAKLKKVMLGPTGMGREAMEAIYTKSELKNLENVATAFEVAQKKQAAGAGGMLVQLAQGGAIVGLATGQMPAGSAAVLLGPEVLSKMMLNPISSRWLTTGLGTVPKSAKHVAAAAARGTRFVEQFTDQKGEQ